MNAFTPFAGFIAITFAVALTVSASFTWTLADAWSADESITTSSFSATSAVPERKHAE